MTASLPGTSAALGSVPIGMAHVALWRVDRTYDRVDGGDGMTYAGPRRIVDADSHVMERPDFLDRPRRPGRARPPAAARRRAAPAST